MADLGSLIRAGAIIPFAARAPADERCGEVVAHGHAHPALGERNVVRLCVKDVAPGADAEMEALGFTRQQVTPRLGQQKFRALGFPGWALVNDPARASFALEVTRDFKKAKKRVRSKPGHARDDFARVAEQLARSVPHFLPSFWEEAGRAFIAEDSDTFAAQCFEKARLVEKEHKLPIDEDVRSAVYLEFALSSAVAAKSLTGYAKELEKRYGAPAAYARYRELSLRRTLGGLPPWVGMGKELRSLASAAKLDVATEERNFVNEVLSSPALKRAPADFWQLYRAPLIELSLKDAAVQTRLRHLFPTPSSGANNFQEFWLALLEEARVCDALLTPSEAEPDPAAAANWLHELIKYRGGDPSLRGYLDRFRQRLAEAKVPLDISHGWRVALAVAEHAATLGIAIAEPRGNERLSIDHIDCDPVHTAQHPILKPMLMRAVGEAMGGVEFETASLGKQGFLEARKAWLEAQLAACERGTLVSCNAALLTLSKQSTPQLFVEFPELYARLKAISLSPALARTLRGGLFAEFAWPVWEEAVRELGGGEKTTVSGFFPHPVLFNGVKAIALGGQRRVGEHDFVLPAGAKVNSVWWLDGQFYVLTQSREGQRAYWSANPSSLLEPKSYMSTYSDDLSAGVPAKDGGFVTQGGTVHAGAHEFELNDVVSDGDTFWKREWHEGKIRLREFNPTTGALGRASWPKFVTPLTEKNDQFRMLRVSLSPLPEGAQSSPLGHSNGVCGFAVREHDREQWEITGVDGRTAVASNAIEALARLPGGDERTRALEAKRHWHSGEVRFGSELFDPDGLSLGVYGSNDWASVGFGAGVPLSCWHFLTARDESGSKALRQASDELAQALLSADDATIGARVKDQLPALTAAELRDAVARAALEAIRLERELRVLIDERSPEHADDAGAGLLDDEQVTRAVGVLAERSWGTAAFSSEVNAVARFFAGSEPSSVEPSRHAWEQWLPRLRAFGVLWALPTTAASSRSTLRRLLQSFRRAGFCDHPERLRVMTGTADAGSPLLTANSRLHQSGSNRYLAKAEHTYGDERPLRILEYSESGAFRDPDGFELEDEHRLTRDDGAWIDTFTSLPEIGETEALPSGLDQVVMERTGLTRAESCVLLFGLGQAWDYSNEVLGKELREALDLKLAEVKVAKQTFADLSAETWLTLLDSAATDNPSELLDLPALAAKLADAWVRTFGKRIALREELVLTVERELDPAVKGARLLTAVLAPTTSPLLEVKETPFETLFNEWPVPTDRFANAAVSDIAQFIAWGFAALPVGDEYRDGLVQLHQRALDALANPSLFLPLMGIYSEPKEGKNLRRLFDALGGELKSETEDGSTTHTRITDRLFVQFIDNQSSIHLQAAVRPGLVPDLEAENLLWQLGQSAPGDALACAAFLRSEPGRRLIARILETPVPSGQYENNPLLSAPLQVKRLQALRGLSEATAQLYLQVLAIPEPSTKNLALWNGWKPAQVKKVAAELVEKQLLVEGKRERAGRDWFLPGPWEKGTGKALPLEGWKQSLYELPRGAFKRTLVPRPVHELFEIVIDRLERGDIPKLEEV